MAGTDSNDDLRAALVGLRRLKARVAELEGAARAPVAVIGVSCRFPGADDAEAFWSLLESGQEAVGPVPADRWDAEAYRAVGRPEEEPGTLGSVRGGFLSDVARFDADLFGISHREARAMDPQQRLLLEAAWSALDDAGRRGDVEGSDTGVFLGVALTDWERRTLYHLDPAAQDVYAGTGSFGSVAAGRISYALGLRGPAVALDTACSSSLVAVHLAVRSLRSGEARMALAGGVNLLLTPDPSLYFAQMGALAPDGRCKAFDAAADGYVRAEGVGVVVLKRLDHALADGDRVLAVIRGTAVNQDGRSNGLTAPSPEAQKRVLRAALADAGAEPGDVGAVEAHGTGTPLGDPIEVEALAEVYGAGERPLVLGAVKTVIGHAEPAAGVAGLVKAVEVARRGRMPANLHFQAPNPRLRLKGTRIVVAAEALPVEGLVGVSSFGMSGTNAHVLVAPPPAVEPGPAGRMHVLALSAPDEARLERLRQAAIRRLGDPGLSLGDAARTAGAGRVHHAHRLVVVAADTGEAAEALRVARPVAAGGRRPRVGVRVGSQLSGAAVTAWADREPAVRAALQGAPEVDAGAAAFAVVRALESFGVEVTAVVSAPGMEAAGEAVAGARAAPWSEGPAGRARRWYATAADAASIASRADVWLDVGGASEGAIPVGGDDVERSVLDAIAALYLRGGEPDWEALALAGGARPRRIAWPGTEFGGPRLWLDDPVEQLRAERRGGGVVWREEEVPWAGGAPTPGARWLDLRGVDGVEDAVEALRAALRGGADGPLMVCAAPDGLAAEAARGFARVAAQERTAGWGGFVTAPLGVSLDAVRAAAGPADGRDRALTEHGLRALRLVPGAAGSPIAVATDGVWWVAGGAGALGLAVAAALADAGVRRLALSARRELTAGPEIEALRARGVEVQLVRGDLSTTEGARAARAGIDGPVVGWVHAAGLLEDRPLGEVDAELVLRHLAAKVGVAQGVAAATQDDPVRQVVLLGSATVSLGIPGQAAYAAANAALRAEAAALRAQGVEVRLVELGPVEGGMADDATRRRLAALGIGALGLAEAARLALRSGDGVLLRFDPTRYARAAGAPRLAAFLGLEVQAAAPSTSPREAVLAELARVLGRDDLGGLDLTRGFFELGLDSMTAVAFARGLEERLGRAVPPTVAFDHGDVEALVAWLAPVEAAATAGVVSARSDEPVAIIGMACRFPGADDPEAFWTLLRSGEDRVRPIPASRWDNDALYDPEVGLPGRSYVREMALLDEIDGFDAGFFGVSPREAASLDPQQRLLLEVGVEALEDAGVPLDAVSRSRTGVYVGIGPSDYARRFDVMEGPADPYAGTGNESSFAAGRLSYVLGAQGPAMGLNTACSTSLVTTHLAAQALQAGECDLALAGGVHLVLSPETTVQLCQLQALSPAGRCHTFSADADGYARGEGCGVLVLKRLSDARRDGDRVLGVLLGTAVNHDGPSAGLTVPSGSAQQALLRTALQRAGLGPADVDLLEAHGTGTRLGDPIELGAVKAVYGERPPDRPLRVGSIKTHIGHLELAAGVAGVIATVQALRHREVAPHLHLGAPNPALDLDFPVRIPTSVETLPADRPLRGAVSSFGLSGTNAHVIVEQGEPDVAGEAPDRSHHTLVWSARSRVAAERMAVRLADAVAARPDAVADLAWSLHVGRSPARWRGTVSGADAAELVARLRAGPEVAEAAGRPVVWMFSGQGAQWAGMGRELRSHPAFAAVMGRADEVLLALRGERLSEVIDAGDGRLDDTAWTQPALVALELALAATLRAMGHTPDVVIGHSVGEIAAACVAGVMDEEAAIRLAAERGRLMSSLPAGGGMVQVGLREDLARERAGSELDVAVINAADETVIAGDVARLDALVATLEAEGVRCRRLVVSHAFHSRRMDPILAPFEAVVAGLRLEAPRIPVLSNLEARPVTDALRDPAYWRRHVREAVRFADGLRAAPAGAVLVEIGPHAVLAGLAARVRPDALTVPTLRRGRPAWEGLAEAVGRLAAIGATIDLRAWDAPWRRAKVAVPTTPWARERHWVEARSLGGVAGRGLVRQVRWEPVTPTPSTPRAWQVEGDGAAEIVAALRAAGDEAVVGWATGPGERVWAVPAGLRDDGEEVAEGLARLRSCKADGARLTVVTAGVSDGSSLVGAGLWGLMRGAALELGEVAAGVVDHLGGDVAAALRAAWPVRRARGGAVEVPRLVVEDGPTALTVRGTWWITGGTGAVGRALAGWLRAHGASRVVVTGRRAPVEPLSDGVELRVGDVSRPDEVHRLLAEIDADGPLAGVIHAAGGLADAALARMTPEQLLAVRPAKVGGAWSLHEALGDRPLDGFVLLSSAASVLGWTGQAAYGAANAWLDALARHRRARGLAATSLAYGPWAGGGMASPAVQAAMAAVGMRAMSPTAALGATQRALAAGWTDPLIADLDPGVWAPTHPWGAALVGAPAQAPSVAASAEAPVVDRRAIEREVRRVVAGVLGHADPAALDATQGLFDLGMDSLMAVHLARELRKALDLDVPDTVAFDRPSVAALVALAEERLAPAASVTAEVRRAVDEPVAIIGLSCRFPGGVVDADSLWALLTEGRDAIGPVPRDRWDNDAFFDPTPGVPGRTYVREGGFLDDVAGFEPGLFGISPREAVRMDPQQRLLLEATWHALEDAGLAPDGLRGARAAVYVGIGGHDYERVIERAGGPDEDDGYTGTGNDLAFAAGRIAWHLGTHGPTLSFDTACSSSLVAVHHAARALRAGEVDLGVAGAVRLMLSPESTLRLSALRALSPRARCRTFDAGADGYVRGEGVGVVILKRLSDAERDGDRVLAVIAASAVNHDGASSGLTVPSGDAQVRLLRDVVSAAGVAPAEVDAIEAHGTGTSLGDPIEVGALIEALGDRPPERPLRIGSIKTQIGHLELAAGMAGLAKAVLALQHDLLPGQLHFERHNPSIPRSDAIAVLSRPEAWSRDHRRIIGVSAFGLSGTNAAVLLADPPAPAPPEASPRTHHLLVVHGATAEGLVANAAATAGWLRRHPEADVADVAWTLATGRARLRHRRALVVRDAAEAADLLASGAGAVDGVVRRGAARPPVCFLFTGQGSQYASMARGLYDAFPVVREVIDRCDAAMRSLRGEGLLPVLFPRVASGAIDQTAWTQPALFAVELAVAELWRSLGVEPDLALGHSIGEIAAATFAGVLSLEDGLAVVEARGRLMQALPSDGAMGAVFAPVAEVEAAVARYGGRVDVAAINGPEETVVSGDGAAVRELLRTFELREVRVRELTVSHAFHSSRMDPMLEAFGQVVSAVRLAAPRVALVSNLTASVEREAFLQPAYWVRHVREAVRFAPSVAAAFEAGARWFVEVGPHPVLAGLGARCNLGPDAQWVASLRRGQDDVETLLAAVGRVHATGFDVDLARLEPRARPRRLGLPGTVFQRERFYVDGGAAAAPGVAPAAAWEVAWRELAATPAAPRRWWVVGAAEGIAPALREAGHEAVVVGGEERELAEAALRAGPPDGIVLAAGGDDAVELTAALVGLARAVPDALGRAVPLWVVTPDAWAGAPAGAAAWGLGRVLALEQPSAWGGVVDLEPGWTGAALADTLCDSHEDQVRLGAVRRVARLVPAALGPEVPLAGGCAVVTGGLGALGLQVAEACVARGARGLVLNGRRGPSEETARTVAAWRARGVAVEIVTGDVVDAAPRLAEVAQRLGGAAVVVHAAGALDDGLISGLDRSRIEAAMAAKVHGALALDAAFPDAPLALFSSAAGWMGAVGQGAYAAANAWMDAFALARTRPERPVTALAFGPWAGAGMAEAHAAEMARRGIRPLAPAAALAAWARAWSRGGALAVAEADWSTFRSLYEQGRGRGLLDEVAPPRRAAEEPRARRGALHEVVAAAAAAVLGARGRVDPEQGFFELGMDSLMTVTLAERLARELGREVPPSAVLDHPTVNRLAGWLRDGEAPPPVVAAPIGVPVDDPVVIVGMSCRFPGAPDVDAFWRLLEDGRCAVGEAPRSRWPEIDALLHPEPGTPGRTYTSRGAFLDAIEEFDAGFFGMSPREAEAMDPQQRLLLEVSWEALEDAGLAPGGLGESRTGVWVGMGASEYDVRFQRRVTATPDAYSGTGNDTSFAAGRIAWRLGLRGPAMTVNTACSASLVSLHLASQALRLGECDLAVVGAVNLMVSSDSTVRLAALRALSPSGLCRAFDADADGYVRGEGAGVVVMARRSEARRRGLRELAVVRGSAVNHDGASSALTVPSGPAQTALLREAWQRAGVSPDDLGYIEAHGTGTRLGDPIEARALAAALGARSRPLPVGSVKTNVGHLELAAGAAGLIKTVLALRHGRVPAHLHLQRLNPEIPTELPLQFSRETVPWVGPRVAGVSSFGLSGTNAHVVLAAADEAPAPAPSRRAVTLLPLAARGPGAVDRLAMAVADRLEDAALADVVRTASASRTSGLHRVAVVGDRADAVQAALRGLTRDGRARSEASVEAPKLALVFGGLGAAWAGMGLSLAAGSEVVADTLAELDAAARPLLGRPLAEVDPAGHGGAAVVALTALQIALWRQLDAWGLQPDVVAAHGAGELAAAVAAGVWSPADAVTVAWARGEAAAAAPAGAMVAFVAGEAAVRVALDGLDAHVAVVNGPESTVVGGTRAALDALMSRLPGVVSFPLPHPVALHTPALAAFSRRVAQAAAKAARRDAAVPLVVGEAPRVHDPRWWADRVSGPVRFDEVCRQLASLDVGLTLEVAPNPQLVGFLRRATGRPALGLCRRDREWETLLEAVAEAWVRGVRVDLEAVADGGRRVALPTTPFERRRHWVDESPPVTPPPVTVGATPATDVRGFVLGEAERLLGLSAGQLDARRPLAWQGFDSIMAADLKVALDRAFGVRVPTDAVISGPSVQELVEVVERLRRAAGG